MPKIFEYMGLIFFFYANEHLPVHVHVSLAEFENKFEIEYESGKLKKVKAIAVKGRLPLPVKDKKEAVRFVEKFHRQIVEKWTEFFVLNKKVSCEVIKQKIK